MMTLRTWLYQTLISDAELSTLVNGRVYPKRSMRSSIEDTPYIIYKVGNATSESLSETSKAYRQYFQLYIHDYSDEKSGDYMRIDTIASRLKTLLQSASSSENSVLDVEYLETSQDLNDETLGTVNRYMRFVAILWR